MQKLAASSVRAEKVLVELFAHFCLVVLWNVSFYLEFLISMGKGARVEKFAFTSLLPILADLSLILDFERIRIFLLLACPTQAILTFYKLLSLI